jgi:hypothetical protein
MAALAPVLWLREVLQDEPAPPATEPVRCALSEETRVGETRYDELGPCDGAWIASLRGVAAEDPSAEPPLCAGHVRALELNDSPAGPLFGLTRALAVRVWNGALRFEPETSEWLPQVHEIERASEAEFDVIVANRWLENPPAWWDDGRYRLRVRIASDERGDELLERSPYGKTIRLDGGPLYLDPPR